MMCVWPTKKTLTAIHNGMPGGIMAFSEKRAWRGGDIATCDHGPYGTVIPRHDEAGMKGVRRVPEADGQPQRTLLKKKCHTGHLYMRRNGMWR